MEKGTKHQNEHQLDLKTKDGGCRDDKLFSEYLTNRSCNVLVKYDISNLSMQDKSRRKEKTLTNL